MKAKVQIKSVLEQISTEVFGMRDVNQARTFIVDFLNSKSIKDEDKKLIIRNIEGFKNINQIHRYLCNSLLKYEGMSVA